MVGSCEHGTELLVSIIRGIYWQAEKLLASQERSCPIELELVWNLVAHGDAREGKWRGNWRMEWVDYSHATSERGLSSITQADAHTSAASSRLNWRPHRFKWTCPFRGKTKSGFCACAITFRTSYTNTIRLDHASAHACCVSTHVWCAVGARFWSYEFATTSDPCPTLHGCSRPGCSAGGRPRNR